jgi:hypothetical protein
MSGVGTLARWVGLVSSMGWGSLSCGDDLPDASPTSSTTALPSTGTSAAATSTSAESGADSTGTPADLPAAPQCDNYDPLRNLYWGDLHVHTAMSFDAWLHDVRTDPDDAYAFARGEALSLPPLDGDGNGTQTIQLAQALDFAAVTDHAEYLAEVAACTTPGNAAYDSALCQAYRVADIDALVDWGIQLGAARPMRFAEVCGPGGVDCPALAAEGWARTIDAAEAAQDTSSACTFTSFVGYEWSAGPGLSNLHRNVIFRSSTVPALPRSYFEATTPTALWDALTTECLDVEGCDVLAIPHNSNWSNGRMFYAEPAPGTDEAAAATRRAQLEPLMEVFQHKGASECQVAPSGILGAPDELCDFEQLRAAPYPDCGDGVGGGAMAGVGCVSRRDFLRGALLEGLREERRIGVNPFQVGVIASTDTHNGTPGAVAEDSYLGHVGSEESDARSRLTGLVPAGPRNNPGGLVAVWATENSRDALFEAMRRRETYGTSGPRIAVRMFAGFDLPEGLCEDPDLVEKGYAQGVPMGGVLVAGQGAAPRFVATALRDPAADGMPLQRVQIVKGWVDADDTSHTAVFDIAGGDNGASVELPSCTPVGRGADTLCGTWTDPDFDPAVPAWYYVRVLENPTCRFSTRDCDAVGDPKPAACIGENLPDTIQERAWSSPVWWTPG